MGAIRNEFFPTPYSKYTVIGLYITLCLIYMAFGIRFSTKLLKMMLKCSPILFLIIFFIYIGTSINIGPVGIGNVKDLERILFGLIFSALGDCFLVFDQLLFIHGLLAFSCTHIVYITLFGGKDLLLTVPTQSELVIAAAIGLVSILVCSYVLPKLRKMLIVPAAMYSILISFMLWCALVTLQHDPRLSTLQCAIGACLFYMSDILLSVKLSGTEIPCGDYLVIMTYYAAQILIFLSVLENF